MNKYIFPPKNFDKLNGYVICDEKLVIEILLKSDSFLFYDTCSLRHHVKLSSPQHIFEFIIANDALVILINMVVSELALDNGFLSKKDIDFIKGMHDAGIKVVVLAEEWLPDLLGMCYRSYEIVNGLISKAVKDVVPAHSDIRDWIKDKPEMYKEIMVGVASTNHNIGRNFFLGIKDRKKSGDDLGETIIALCTHLLMNVPYGQMSFYILSDDKGAATLLGRLNTKRNDGDIKVCFISTAKLCWVLNRKYELCDKEQVKALLSCISGEDRISVSCTCEYDLRPMDRLYYIDDLAELIANEKTFTVYI